MWLKINFQRIHFGTFKKLQYIAEIIKYVFKGEKCNLLFIILNFSICFKLLIYLKSIYDKGISFVQNENVFL